MNNVLFLLLFMFIIIIFFNFSDPSLGSKAEKILFNIDYDFWEHILFS